MTNLKQNNFKTELKFVYSENSSLSIVFQDNDLVLGVVGEFNNNLKELEKLTNTKIYSRVKNKNKESLIAKKIDVNSYLFNIYLQGADETIFFDF